MNSLQYILAPCWLMIMALFGHAAGAYRKERVLGQTERRATWFYALMVILPLIVFAGTRSLNFGDGYAYWISYRVIPDSFGGKIQYILNSSKDQGYYALEALISIFLPRNRMGYFTVIAALQVFFLAKTYRKFSEDFWLAMFVFVASTDYLSWVQNGMRQFLAATLAFAAAGLLFRRKLLWYSVVVLIASTFHRSALLLIPVAFFVQGRAWNWKMLLILLGTIVVMNYTGLFTSLLGSVLEDTQYRNVAFDMTYYQDDGTNPLRVLVYSIPTILSLFCRKKINREGGRVVQIACNMGIVSTAMYLLSMVTSGILIGRLPIYCSLYANGILLPWELKHMFAHNTGKVIRMAALGCYLLFYVFTLHFQWGLI